jgi:hypothetical protein
MDVRGYVYTNTIMSSAASVGFGDHNATTLEQTLESYIASINQDDIKHFFQQNVCPGDEHDNDNQSDTDHDGGGGNMEYFKAKIHYWDITMAPAPPLPSHEYPYPSTKDRRHFNHNLRLLCDGGVDAVYPNYHKKVYQFGLKENMPSLVVGIIVGFIMIGMIYTELQKKENNSNNNNNNNNNSQQQPSTTRSTRRDQYEQAPQLDESIIELV